MFKKSKSKSKSKSNYLRLSLWVKATGLDKIPNRLLKIAADVVTPSLTGVFNQSLMTGIFPSDWKLAEVSPIFKNGSTTNSYRPISVIPTVAKIFEKNICDQLYQYLNENFLFNSGKSCFRSLHSTLTDRAQKPLIG